jgi:hypothetical protein
MAPHGHEHHSGWSTPGKFYKGRSQERTRLGLPDISLLVPEAKDRVSHGEPLGGGIHEEESKAVKIKSCENQTRTARPRARQIGGARQPSIT